MDEVTTMTVPPALPAKTQARSSSQGTRQTVSIRTVSPTSSPSLTTSSVGATVFVGVNAPADSTATCRRRIPEVQSANGYVRQSSIQTSQQQPQQQQQQQAAHVVKIKINPDGDKNGRVISTVRLTLDGNAGHEIENGIRCERSSNRDGAVVVSATNLVNEKRCASGAGESCVRISVGGGNLLKRNNNNNNNHNNNNHNNNNHNNNNKNYNNNNNNNDEKDMVQRGTSSETLNSSPLNNRSNNACFYYNSFQSPLAGSMVMSSGQCSPSDTLDSGTCSDLDGTPPPLPKKKNASTVILTGGQHDRTGSLTSSGAEVDSDDNESNISCDSLNGRELSDRIGQGNVNGSRSSSKDADAVGDYTMRSRNDHFTEEGKNEDGNEVNDVTTKFEVLELTNGNSAAAAAAADDDEDDDDDDVPLVSTELLESNVCSIVRSSSVSPSPSGTSSSLSKASSTPRVRSPDPLADQNGRLSSPVIKECTYEERKQEQERIEQECAAADFYANYNRSNGNKYVYDDDRFYKFHLNEFGNDNEESGQEPREPGLGEKEIDECFAGYKILEREAIRSAKGTVRGVKNRVRAGIATFLQKPSSKVGGNCKIIFYSLGYKASSDNTNFLIIQSSQYLS